MNLEDARTIQRGYLPLTVRMLAGSAPGSRLWERGALSAAIVPATPDQPMANRVITTSGRALVRHLPQIAVQYQAAGVRKWSIWTERHNETRDQLTAAGYDLASTEPAIMFDLTDFDPDLGDLDYDDGGDMATLGEINGRAYPNGHGLSAAMVQTPADMDLRIYQARLNGEVVSMLATLDQFDARDCTAHWAATLPEARGRRIAPRLLSAALADARKRGCLTASGTASPMGGPVWAKLGWHTMYDYDVFVWGADDDAR
ncbi:MAG: GNAT family N-acetyltransferase [Actinobacteria bacterium]|nr:GNAT family N-acetyltransferase [Actinomycetota bacterium]